MMAYFSTSFPLLNNTHYYESSDPVVTGAGGELQPPFNPPVAQIVLGANVLHAILF